jgi:hypothetical protein
MALPLREFNLDPQTITMTSTNPYYFRWLSAIQSYFITGGRREEKPG